MLDALVDECSAVGLLVNAKKTKAMATMNGKIALSLKPSGLPIEQKVDFFKYLGTRVTPNACFSVEIQRRIGLAASNFNALRRLVWRQRLLPAAVKLTAFLGLVVSVLLYGSEAWAPTKADIHDLEVFYHRCLRTMYGARWEDHIHKLCPYQSCTQGSLTCFASPSTSPPLARTFGPDG